jgi:AcrR family transcriptional regulator
MRPSPRPSLSPDAIIEAAERLINDTGSAVWTVRSLSDRLNCAPGALYRYFPGGTGEIEATVRERDFTRLAARLTTAEADTNAPGLASLAPGTHGARLARRYRAYLDFAAGNPAMYRQLFGRLRGGETPLPGAGVEQVMIGRPAELIVQAARARELVRPRIGEGESKRLAVLMWIQLHGFADLRTSAMVSAMAGGLPENIDIRVLVNLLAMADFAVAATPAGLEAAAVAAEGRASGAVPASRTTTPARSPRFGGTTRFG